MDEKLGAQVDEEQQQRLERDHISRRTFLMNVGIALNAAVGLALAVPVVAYVLGPVIRRKEYLQWIAIGNASDFPPGETRLVTFRNPFSDPWDGDTAKVPAYVRCTQPGTFVVFAINCAHLGCPVRWFAESQLFMCPCHGGVYYADGTRASGPPERGLFTYDVKVESGKIMIDAGQMPTLKNRASADKTYGTRTSEPKIVARIEPCRNSKDPGTGASTTG
jgi:Rieske Fe-S protein